MTRFSFTIYAMSTPSMLARFGFASPWSRELVVALIALLIGIGVMPLLIFYVGAATLGRYEGATLGRLYGSVFTGLAQASTASWIVLLGPYGLYLLFKALRAWWRAGNGGVSGEG